jgi:CO/xanthine dehydrogenase Mo-binding subunit
MVFEVGKGAGHTGEPHRTGLFEFQHRFQGAVLLQGLPGRGNMKLQHVKVVSLHAGETLLDTRQDVIAGKDVRAALAAWGRRRSNQIAAFARQVVLGAPVRDVAADALFAQAVVNRGVNVSVTGGSSVTFKTGWAVDQAAQDVKRQMCERAAKLWECAVEDVVYEAGVLQRRADPTRRLTCRQLAARQLATGGPVMGRAGVNPAGPGSALGTHIVDVEVDPETGKVQILRYTSVQDVGKAIHPSYVEGQIQGGSVQGIGWALHEEYLFSERGHMLNASYLDYRVPVCLDLPMIDIVLVEVPNPNHPFGVRGVGEKWGCKRCTPSCERHCGRAR